MRTLRFALFAACLSGCTPAFFQPHQAIVSTPGLFGIDYQPVELRAEDDTALFAWFLPARGTARGSVLYLHGNAENISTHFANVAWMPAAGLNVLALDYRGYGGSQGRPSLNGMQLDIDAALRALARHPGVDSRCITLFGQSLGGALAIYYAAYGAHRSLLSAVVADSAFSDYHAISREKLASVPLTWPLQWLPRFTVDNAYSPEAAIGAVSPMPLLLVHGERDSVVPMHHAQRLFERAGEPRELWIVPEVGHIQAVRRPEVRSRLAAFLARRCQALPAASLR